MSNSLKSWTNVLRNDNILVGWMRSLWRGVHTPVVQWQYLAAVYKSWNHRDVTAWMTSHWTVTHSVHYSLMHSCFLSINSSTVFWVEWSLEMKFSQLSQVVLTFLSLLLGHILQWPWPSFLSISWFLALESIVRCTEQYPCVDVSSLPVSRQVSCKFQKELQLPVLIHDHPSLVLLCPDYTG
jgi:hypothetical protein